MADDHPAPPPPQPLHNVYNVSNIKAHEPIQLNLDHLNYKVWSKLFYTHCSGFDVEDHIDDTYEPTVDDPNNAPRTNCEWLKLDSIVKSWLYGTITPYLLQNIFQPNLIARQTWLNLHNLFQVNKDARAIQLDNELRSITLGNMTITDY